MARVAEIIEFLRGIGATDADAASGGAGDAEVTGVRTDEEAGPGDLAWVSAKRAAADPGRVARFRGTMLLCPREAALPEEGGPAVVVPVRNVKLAFSRVMGRFFGDLGEMRWPADGRVAEDARIAPGVRLAPGVVIGGGTVLHEGVSVGPNTVIANAEIGPNARIGANCTIGLPGFGYERDEATGQWFHFPHVGRVFIGADVEIGSNTCVDRGGLGDTRLERGCKIDNLVHVAHNVFIGEDAIITANAMLAGSARVDRGAWIAPSVAVLNQLRVGEDAMIGLGAVVIRDVEPGATIVGNPGKPLHKKTG